MRWHEWWRERHETWGWWQTATTGCESADLAGAYILENTKSHFRQTKGYGLCRDDGMAGINNNRNFHAITCSSGEPRSRTQWTDQHDATAYNSPATSGQTSQKEKHQKHRTSQRCWLKQRTSFLVYMQNQSGQLMKPTIPSTSQAKPTTEAFKHGHNWHQSFCFKAMSWLKAFPIECPNWQQSLKQTDNNHSNKQGPTVSTDKICAQHFHALQHVSLITKKTPQLT